MYDIDELVKTSDLVNELRTIMRRKAKIAYDRAESELGDQLRGCGIWGIAVDTDPLALEWQVQEKRKVEIMKELGIFGL